MNAHFRWPPITALALGVALLACGAALFFFDPARAGFYPICYFHQLTGLNCPGCGGLRAVHQLLHGHVAAALRLNPLFVAALPLFGWAAGRFLLRRIKGEPARIEIPRRWLWAGLAVLVGFGVLRNVF